MPISQGDLVELAKVSLDHYLRNIPVDNIGTEHLFLKKLLSIRKPFAGAKQGIVENVREEYGSGFKWAYGAEPVVFNKHNTTEDGGASSRFLRKTGYRTAPWEPGVGDCLRSPG